MLRRMSPWHSGPERCPRRTRMPFQWPQSTWHDSLQRSLSSRAGVDCVGRSPSEVSGASQMERWFSGLAGRRTQLLYHAPCPALDTTRIQFVKLRHRPAMMTEETKVSFPQRRKAKDPPESPARCILRGSFFLPRKAVVMGSAAATNAGPFAHYRVAESRLLRMGAFGR